MDKGIFGQCLKMKCRGLLAPTAANKGATYGVGFGPSTLPRLEGVWSLENIVMSLAGKCNQCGICCFVGAFKCEHLEIAGIPGMPMATRCRIYDKRYIDMPIILADPHGAVKQGYCLHNSQAEEDTLIKLIRFGQCSLQEDLSHG